jgi:hypothetical protein
MRRLMNKKLWKDSFKTLGWAAFKQQIKFAMNQSKNFHWTIGLAIQNNKPTNLREMQSNIVKRTYLDSKTGGGMIPAFGWSEEVTRPMQLD